MGQGFYWRHSHLVHQRFQKGKSLLQQAPPSKLHSGILFSSSQNGSLTGQKFSHLTSLGSKFGSRHSHSCVMQNRWNEYLGWHAQTLLSDVSGKTYRAPDCFVSGPTAIPTIPITSFSVVFIITITITFPKWLSTVTLANWAAKKISKYPHALS